MRKHSPWAGIAAIVLSVWLSSSAVRASGFDFLTVIIDSQTALPVATGLSPDSMNVHYVILAEGAAQRIYTSQTTEGWFDASGQTRFQRAGQIFLDMPFGALIGEFGVDLAEGFYVGDGGVMRAQPIDVGNQLILGLNMSNADHASMQGIVVAHIAEVQGSVESNTFHLDASSPIPLATGMTSDHGQDEWIVLAKGAAQVVSIWPVTEGWIDPSGEIRLKRAGQPIGDMPFGCLLGQFVPDGGQFFIGDGGGWSAQPADLTKELNLFLNMSAADQASMSGEFVATVIKLPGDKVVGIEDPNGRPEAGIPGRSFPNPTEASARIRYSVPEGGKLLLRIYDATGRWMRTLVDESVAAGEHVVVWDGEDDNGRKVASGVYFYQLSTRSGSETHRVTLLR